MTEAAELTGRGAVEFAPPMIVLTGDLTGDQLRHPDDTATGQARMVVRWGTVWAPCTWATRRWFESRGVGGEDQRYTDADVTGWHLVEPEAASLADEVRSGRLDIGDAVVTARVVPADLADRLREALVAELLDDDADFYAGRLADAVAREVTGWNTAWYEHLAQRRARSLPGW